MWLEKFPLGERVSFSCQHLGIEYPGEVARADTWSPRLGHLLSGEVYFRVALLRQRRGGLEPVIQDPRIAVCLPAVGQYRRRSRLATEISTTRETQAVYLAQPNTEAELIRQTLRRRLDELEEQLLGEDSVRYSEGQVIAGIGLAPQPEIIFAGMDPNAWFYRLAGWLLSQAYPKLPLELGGLSEPIDGEGAANAFAAYFGQHHVPPDVMEQLGPALGLTGKDNQENSGPVFDLIRTRISQQSEPFALADLHRYLAHEIGLTGPLATMFLLVYLHRHRPHFAIELQPSHRVALLDGRPLLIGQITPDLIPALRWDQRVSQWAGRIVPMKETGEETSWNDALQHLAALSPRLAAAETEEAIRAQEQILLEDLKAWTQAVVQARELVDGSDWTADQPARNWKRKERWTGCPQCKATTFRLSMLLFEGIIATFGAGNQIWPSCWRWRRWCGQAKIFPARGIF